MGQKSFVPAQTKIVVKLLMNGRNFAHSITSEWDKLIQKMIFHILVNYSIQTKVVYSIHLIMLIVMPLSPSYEQQSLKQHVNLLALWVAQRLLLGCAAAATQPALLGCCHCRVCCHRYVGLVLMLLQLLCLMPQSLSSSP